MVVHCSNVLRRKFGSALPHSGLVVGCGSGDEVVYIRQQFDTNGVLGVDIEANFSLLARAEGCVLWADAKHLPLASESFEFAASFHSLEHVGDPRAALDEVRRVLNPGGWFYVGVPNRARLVGYLGSFDATPWQKITWNFQDWWDRVRGRFHNESEAHAGFDRSELLQLLKPRFDQVEILTEEFVRFKYAGRLPGVFLDWLLAPNFADYSVPAHYALCQKPG
jgi:SAM-dependent methyltransferase